MSELPDEVWWYTENDGDPRSVTMEPEGGGLPQSSQSCQKAAHAAHIMQTDSKQLQQRHPWLKCKIIRAACPLP